MFIQCIKFEIAMSSWWIGPFIIRKWSPLSLVTLFCLKIILCDVILCAGSSVYIDGYIPFILQYFCAFIFLGAGNEGWGVKRKGRLRLTVAWLRRSYWPEWPPRHPSFPSSLKRHIYLYTFSERKCLGGCNSSLGSTTHTRLRTFPSQLWPILEKL